MLSHALDAMGRPTLVATGLFGVTDSQRLTTSGDVGAPVYYYRLKRLANILPAGAKRG